MEVSSIARHIYNNCISELTEHARLALLVLTERACFALLCPVTWCNVIGEYKGTGSATFMVSGIVTGTYQAFIELQRKNHGISLTEGSGETSITG